MTARWSVLIVGAAAAAVAPTFAQRPPSVLAVRNVALIDGTGAALRPNVTIVLTGNRITAIQAATAPVPAGARVVEGTGMYVIPGLWDMHVHLGDATSSEPALTMFLAAGVTGVRDMGSPRFERLRSWREEIARGERAGPRIVAPGPLLQAGPPVDSNHVEIRDSIQARRVVDSLADLGVDFIKVHEILTRAEYFAIADEARRRGLPHAGHLPVRNDTVLVTAVEAVTAGQRSLEHLAGIPYYIRDVSHAAMYDSLRATGAYVDPTLQPYWALAHVTDSALWTDPRLHLVPAFRRAQWEDIRGHRSAAGQAFMARLLEWRMAAVHDLQVAGVPLLAGTDVGVLPLVYPGTSLHDELVRLVESGLTPLEALQSATINPARFLGRERDLGTIEVGKLADLVVLDANPLRDIANVGRVRWVIADGRLFDERTLIRTKL
jgi:imidazolonepropionase-like amidohydrolase